MPERKQLAQYIFTVPRFLTETECEELIELSESIGYTEAPVTMPGGKAIINKDVRNNDRVMVDDLKLADALWSRAQPFCPAFYKGYSALGLNERFRFYSYQAGQVFRWHTDGAYRRRAGETSRLTFMIYLNDDFAGGETLFEHVKVEPQTGMALIFAHSLLHEGGEVFSGRKYVLRTDVMYSAEVHELED